MIGGGRPADIVGGRVMDIQASLEADATRTSVMDAI